MPLDELSTLIASHKIYARMTGVMSLQVFKSQRAVCTVAGSQEERSTLVPSSPLSDAPTVQ